MSETTQKQELAKAESEKTKAVVKKYTPEEAKQTILKIMHSPYDLEYLAKELGEKILPEFFGADEKAKKAATKELVEKAKEVFMAMGLDTHLPLVEAVDERYRTLAKELSAQVIREYECVSGAEKALAQIVTASYIATIDASRRLTNSANTGEYITENRTKYLAMLSKQVDRTNRQFLSALLTLKQLKAPTIEMTIQAKTAFVSQNQQVNVKQETNEAK